MGFGNLDSWPGKSWNVCPGHGKSWTFLLANMYAADLIAILDCSKCVRETH